MATKVEEEVQNLNPDFSEVDWKVASPELQQRITDYGSLEAVKKLLEGAAIEVPTGTYLNRLYRWLNNNGYHLRRRTFKNSLVIWVEKKPETPSEESITVE